MSNCPPFFSQSRKHRPFGHGEEPLWAEGALGVDVHGFSFPASPVDGQLGENEQT